METKQMLLYAEVNNIKRNGKPLMYSISSKKRVMSIDFNIFILNE